MPISKQAPNRKCLTCGTPYYFCACHKNTDRAVWNINCCTPSHFQIFVTALDVRDGNITMEDARKRLYGLKFYKKDLAWCADDIRAILSPVFERKKPAEPEEGEMKEGE